jgi:hypothetical protein
MFKTNRSIFSGLGIITLLIIITVSGFSLFLNDRCQRSFWDNQMIYPGAERLDEESVFLGVQRVVYHSPDAPTVIDRWYLAEYEARNAARNAAQMREAVVSGNFEQVEDAPTRNWVVEPDGQGGSTIMLAAICPSGSPTF